MGNSSDSQIREAEKKQADDQIAVLQQWLMANANIRLIYAQKYSKLLVADNCQTAERIFRNTQKNPHYLTSVGISDSNDAEDIIAASKRIFGGNTLETTVQPQAVVAYAVTSTKSMAVAETIPSTLPATPQSQATAPTNTKTVQDSSDATVTKNLQPSAPTQNIVQAANTAPTSRIRSFLAARADAIAAVDDSDNSMNLTSDLLDIGGLSLPPASLVPLRTELETRLVLARLFKEVNFMKEGDHYSPDFEIRLWKGMKVNDAGLPTTLSMQNVDLSNVGIIGICRMTFITMLCLNSCHIQELPQEIGMMTSVAMLYLMDNRLTDLPSSISKMRSLAYLLLSRNQFTSILPVMLIPNLLLYLDSNQITEFPSLPRNTLHALYLSGNTVVSDMRGRAMVMQVARQSNPSIKLFLVDNFDETK